MGTRAFTLIELLIVVAIIAILAAIAVPNFLEAQVRAKVSRSRNDVRSIATTLEMYAVDNNRYPLVGGSYGDWDIINGAATHTLGIENCSYSLPVCLTTPVAYASALPMGSFNQKPDASCRYDQMTPGAFPAGYWYGTLDFFIAHGWQNQWRVGGTAAPQGAYATFRGPANWVLLNKGPDGVWAKDSTEEVDYPQLYQYDATNGTMSVGNVFRCG